MDLHLKQSEMFRKLIIMNVCNSVQIQISDFKCGFIRRLLGLDGCMNSIECHSSLIM